MVGAERLKEKILEEARQQARATVEKAEKEAAVIIDGAKKEAQDKKAEIIDKARLDAADREKRLIAVAELDARKQRLQAKQEVLEQAFTKTLDKLINLPADQYQEILLNMVVDSVTAGNEEIIVSEQDKQRLTPDFIATINKKLKEKGIAANVKLSNESRQIDGGFILKMGAVEANYSFGTIIRMQRDAIEAEVVKVLFA